MNLFGYEITVRRVPRVIVIPKTTAGRLTEKYGYKPNVLRAQ